MGNSGSFRDTGSIEHKTQNKNKQNKNTRQKIQMTENTDPIKNVGHESGARDVLGYSKYRILLQTTFQIKTISKLGFMTVPPVSRLHVLTLFPVVYVETINLSVYFIIIIVTLVYYYMYIYIYRYLIYFTRRVSVTTIVRFSGNQKIGKLKNVKVLRRLSRRRV